ncbi:hypothetical protein GCM10027341_08350 [Spirosoma knui]
MSRPWLMALFGLFWLGLPLLTKAQTPDGVTVAGGLPSAATQFDYASGVYVDGLGNVYVSDESNHRIQKWEPGATQGITVAGGNGEGSGANQLSYPHGVFVDGAGNTYVVDRYNNRIQKFPPNSTSATSGTTVAGGNGAGSGANQLNRPLGIYVDGTDNLYVSDADNHRIQKFPPNSTSATAGTTVAGGNGAGSGDNQLEDPSGVYVDGAGNIYVADTDNTRIQKFSPNSTSATSGTTVAGGNGNGSEDIQLDRPYGVWVDGQGTIYVADSGNDRIQMFPPNSTSATAGTTVAGGNGEGGGANQFDFPEGLFVDGAGNIYVADAVNSRIQKWAPGATQGTTVAGTLWTYPEDLFVDGGGSIYVADSYYYRIQKWAPGATQGINVAGDNSYNGSGATQLNNPQGVFVDGQGYVYVADSRNHRIQKFPPNSTLATEGITVAGGNGQGRGGTQLDFPRDVFVDGQGYIYVADRRNHRIQKFPPNSTSATEGITVAGGNGQGSGANQFTSPYGVFVDGAGNIYVADYGNARIQKFPPSSTSATSGTTVAGGNDYGSGASQLATPSGVYVDGAGNVYVADAGNDRIQKWAPGATQGITVAGGNGYGSGANQFKSPSGVVVDGQGYVYVADSRNYRIQKFPPLPATVTELAVTPNPVCAGQPLTFTASVGNVTGSYSYTLTNGTSTTTGTSSTTAFSQNLTASGQGAQTYTLTIGTTGGSTTASVGVTVNALPAPAITNLASSFCKDASAVTLTGTPVEGGVFTVDGTTATSFNPTSLSVGTHTVRYTVTTNGCSGSTEQTVTINALPTAQITNLASSFCKNASAVTLTGTPPEGGVFTVDGQSATLFSPTSLSVGTHTVRYTVTTNGCSAYSEQSVEINALPAPAITNLASSFCKDAQAVTLTGTPTEGGVFTIDGQNTSQLNPANLTVGNHTIRYTVTTNGCSAYSEQSVEIKALPVPAITNLASSFCKDASAVTLTGTPVEGGVFTVDGTTATSFNPTSLSVGTHTVRYTVTADGCSAYSEQTVTIETVPSAGLTNTGPLSATNTTVTLTATGGSSYSFSAGAAQQGGGAMATVTTPGVYSVTATSNGCSSTASTTVTGGVSSLTVCRGGTAVISVAVSGSPVKYEWYKNSLSTPKIMETPQLFRGTATSSLTLINAQSNTQGDFYLKVTDRSNSVVVYGPYRLVVDASCRAREGAAVEPEVALQVELAPNPLQQDRLRAVVRGAEGRLLQVELVDLQGHSVRQQRWPQAEAEQVIDWDMQSQGDGVYLLQVVSEAGQGLPAQRRSVKVIKL